MPYKPKYVVVEEYTNVVYTSGQGGTPIYSSKVSNIDTAAVVEISGQSAGVVELKGLISAVNLQSGTINGVAPTSNEAVLFLYTAATGTIVEEPTGTISETIKVQITGY